VQEGYESRGQLLILERTFLDLDFHIFFPAGPSSGNTKAISDASVVASRVYILVDCRIFVVVLQEEKYQAPLKLLPNTES